MPRNLAGIRRFVASQLWAVWPEYLDAMLDVLQLRATEGRLSEEEIAARIAAAQHGALGQGANAPKTVAPNSGMIAVLPLYGLLSPKGDMVERVSGPPGTSTQAFGKLFEAAMANEQISAIVIDVDSPGGVVNGVHELATQIAAARGTKRIVASVTGMAASAAYWVATAADEVVVTPSGDVGSIGVYTVHSDLSAKLEKEGVKTTIVKAGKYKAEGDPTQPLSEEAAAALQARVDAVYAMFTTDVAKHMGVKAADVRDGFGEGRVVGAKQALEFGMVHKIATLDETLDRLASSNRKPSPRGQPSGHRADVERRRLDLTRARAAL